jgi:Putative restriction endonuclease
MTSAPSRRYQWALTRLLARLLSFADSVNLALFVAPTDGHIPHQTQAEPDRFVMTRTGEFDGGMRWVPMTRLLLSAEILSRPAARLDRECKRLLYLGEGLPDYGIVDTRASAVHVWRPNATSAKTERKWLTWQSEPKRLPLVVDLEAYFGEARECPLHQPARCACGSSGAPE